MRLKMGDAAIANSEKFEWFRHKLPVIGTRTLMRF